MTAPGYRVAATSLSDESASQLEPLVDPDPVCPGGLSGLRGAVCVAGASNPQLPSLTARSPDSLLSAAAADPFVAGFDTLLLAMGVNGAMGSIGLVRPPVKQ